MAERRGVSRSGRDRGIGTLGLLMLAVAACTGGDSFPEGTDLPFPVLTTRHLVVVTEAPEGQPGPILIQGTRAYLEGLSSQGVVPYEIPPTP